MLHRRLLSLAAIASVFLGACLLVQDLGSTDGANGGGDASTNDVMAEGGPDDGRADASTNGNDGATRFDLYGALPGGYCCSSDEQCRFRHCLPTDAGRMCIDECTPETQASCNRPGIDFSCEFTPPLSGCFPMEPFTCIDPASFVQGAKDAGECCAERSDGLRGQECKSNLCITPPYPSPATCTRVCEAGVDCPDGWQCRERLTFSICVPPPDSGCQ